MTHNQYKRLFSDIASNHNDINSFHLGDTWEYTANQADANFGVVLWVVVQDNVITGKMDSPKYTFIVMDSVNKDESNEDEVLSDTQRILKDIIAILRQPYYETYFRIQQSFTLTDFTEKFDSEMAGWQCDISFDQPFLYDSCQANISGLPTIIGTNN